MGFLIVDISPPSIVGIPAFAVAPDLTLCCVPAMAGMGLVS
jgi:hypothetical protein